LAVGEGDEELGAELPAVGGVAPHGGVGASVGERAVEVVGGPVALFGGEGIGGGDFDAVGEALVGERGLGRVEALLEELEVGLAGGTKAPLPMTATKSSPRESATPRRLRRVMERLECSRAARMLAMSCSSWVMG
jgi:hypothetical protein